MPVNVSEFNLTIYVVAYCAISIHFNRVVLLPPMLTHPNATEWYGVKASGKSEPESLFQPRSF